jgi:hypothetical protein
MVLPIGEFTITEEVEVIDDSSLPTYTYRLDFEKGRCIGMTDGLDAMKQAIFKVLSTNRFEHLIYSDDYGFENPVGQDEVFVRAEIPRRIQEALLQDERITSVEDMNMNFTKDSATISFTCHTLYGDVDVLREVSKDV